MNLPSKNGQTIHVHAHGRLLLIKKLASGSWFLRVQGEERARFGNAEETRADILHFLGNGALPRSKGGWA